MTDFTVWIDAEEMSGQSLPLWASILIIGIALTGAVLVVVPWFTGGAKPDRSYTGTTPVLSGIICMIVAQCLFLMLSWLPVHGRGFAGSRFRRDGGARVRDTGVGGVRHFLRFPFLR